MSSHLRIRAPSYPQRVTFLVSFSWGMGKGSRGEKLPLNVDSLLDACQPG